MEGIILSSTTDSREQMQKALEQYGYTEDSVEVVRTHAAEASDPNEPASAEPPADGEPGEAADTSADEPGASDIQEPEKGHKKGKKGIQDRIDELTRARRDAERQAEELRRERDELQARLANMEKPGGQPAGEPEPGATSQPTDDPEPDLANYESYDEWVKDHQKWTARQEAAPLRAEIVALKSKIAAQENAEAERRARQPEVEAFLVKIEKAEAAHPDYKQAVEQSVKEGLTSTAAMSQEIFESDLSGEILYYLATHPDECRRIASETSVSDKPTPEEVARAVRRAAREIGRIETLLASPQPEHKAPDNQKPKPSAAPPPVRIVGTRSASQTPDPGKMSPAEYREWRKAHPHG